MVEMPTIIIVKDYFNILFFLYKACNLTDFLFGIFPKTNRFGALCFRKRVFFFLQILLSGIILKRF